MQKNIKDNKKVKIILEYMIAASFVLSTFANVISYYFTGNKNEMLRKVISWGIIFVITLCLVIYVIHKWVSSSTRIKKRIILCMIPLGLNGGLLFFSLLNASDKSYILKICLSWGSYCVALVCGAIYIMAEERFEYIIFKMKYIAGIMIPFWSMAIWYLGNLSVKDDFSKGFGGLTHLALGYSVVVIYSFLICDVAMTYKKKEKNKVYYLVVVIEIMMCSLISVMSGGRGALIAWGTVSIAASIALFIKKERAVIGSILLGGLAVIAFYIIAPADNASLNRQFRLISELKSGDVERSLSSEEGEKLLQEISNAANTSQGVADFVNGIDITQLSEETDKQYKEAVYSVTNGNMARVYLWKLAIKEASQKPLLGMGPVGYQLKYKTYPHNILLECMSDFGLPIGIFFAGICAISVILIIKYSLVCRKYFSLMIILSGQAVYVMLSGALYSCDFLLFALTIVIWELCARQEGGVKRGAEKKNN